MRIVLIVLVSALLWQCGHSGQEGLPIFGERYIGAAGDTVYHQVGEFAFVDQDSQLLTQASYLGKVYVADFFFTQCPSFCPPMTGQKLRLYERFKGSELLMISHSIDPERDSVPALKAFAENIGVEGAQWRFVTAPLEYTKEVASRYLLPAGADATAPGGFYHSDKLVLIDRKGRIRGFYSGVDKEAVNKLMEDAALLMAEK